MKELIIGQIQLDAMGVDAALRLAAARPVTFSFTPDDRPFEGFTGAVEEEVNQNRFVGSASGWIDANGIAMEKYSPRLPRHINNLTKEDFAEKIVWRQEL